MAVPATQARWSTSRLLDEVQTLPTSERYVLPSETHLHWTQLLSPR